MVYQGAIDIRGFPRYSQLEVNAVADTEIFATGMANAITNTSISVYTIQATPNVAGKLIAVDSNGYEKYLAGSATTDWEVNVPILVSYMMCNTDTLNLKYSETATLADLLVVESGGIY